MPRTISADHRAKLQVNAAKARKARKRNAASVRREVQAAVASYVLANPNATTREIAENVDVNVSPVLLGAMVEAKVLKVSGKVETGKAGRPMHRFVVLARGRKLAA